MKKILYVTTIGTTMNFFKSLFRDLCKKGYKIDIASNIDIAPVDVFYHELGCNIFKIPCTRNVFSVIQNIKAIRSINKIIRENKYDIVHCHTPVAAFCTRLACAKIRRKGLKVIYTAHGFHFYKGAPMINWFLYFPLEWIFSFMTDILITINKEDYYRASRHFHSKKIEYIPGVGVDISKFANCNVDIKKQREELGIPNDAFLIISVGELNVNKNHQLLIKSLEILNEDKIYCIIVGDGPLKSELLKLIKSTCINKNIFLSGTRNDIPNILKSADLYVHTALREGLPVSVMEAMSSGLNIITSNIRGCNELINKEFTYNELFDCHELANKIKYIMNHKIDSSTNYIDISNFDVSFVNTLIEKLYKSLSVN